MPIATNYFTLLRKSAIKESNLKGHLINTNLRTYFEDGYPGESLYGEGGGTKYTATPIYGKGMFFRTYNQQGDCQSQIKYNKDGSIGYIITYNEDGDTLVLEPSKVKREGGEEIGYITSPSGKQQKPLVLQA